MRGAYILLIKLKKNQEAQIGSLGTICFEKGTYAYIGSAMNSLEKRIGRHLSKEKKKHWHIDYLLASKNASIEKAFFRESNKKEECAIAIKIAELGKAVKGFGCSDCNCKSHLFKIKSANIIKELNGFRLFK